MHEYGLPIAIKAVAGGGGRGFRVVHDAAELAAAFAGARREAELGFGNAEVYVEKYLTDPRHIEIQVLADAHGQVIHLGERECSVQRRHQKLIEECPSPAIDAELRERMGRAAVELTRAVGYCSAGTLEFVLQDGAFFFLEMNTRIQVEHTVTEMVTGVDLVQAQIRIARGEPLWLRQADITWRGHAIECRVNAEDPAAGFRPALGTLGEYREPAGFGVRVDSGVYAGYRIPQYYDSLLAKLIAWGADRSEALRRMQRALADYRITGVAHTLPFHQLALAHPVFRAGDATVNFIPQHLAGQLAQLEPQPPSAEPAAAEIARHFAVEVNGQRFAVRIAEQTGNGVRPVQPARCTAPARRSGAVASSDGITSGLQGTVSAVVVAPGQAVEAGQVLFVIEAMKMENEVSAPHSGTINSVHVGVGQAVEPGSILATFQ